jgi:ribonucleoside-diphosphate reductase alpha chain
MQRIGEIPQSATHLPTAQWSRSESGDSSHPSASALADFKVIRRNGAVVGFEPGKISDRDDQGVPRRERRSGRRVGPRPRTCRAAHRIDRELALMRASPQGGTFHIEDIQDQVELALMRSGEHEVARAYVLYREKRTQRARPPEAKRRRSRNQVIQS